MVVARESPTRRVCRVFPSRARGHVCASYSAHAARACDSVQKITVVFRPMPGVAHTFGSDAAKEIHFSLDHIANSARRARDEIMVEWHALFMAKFIRYKKGRGRTGDL